MWKNYLDIFYIHITIYLYRNPFIVLKNCVDVGEVSWYISYLTVIEFPLKRQNKNRRFYTTVNNLTFGFQTDLKFRLLILKTFRTILVKVFKSWERLLCFSLSLEGSLSDPLYDGAISPLLIERVISSDRCTSKKKITQFAHSWDLWFGQQFTLNPAQ